MEKRCPCLTKKGEPCKNRRMMGGYVGCYSHMMQAYKEKAWPR